MPSVLWASGLQGDQLPAAELGLPSQTLPEVGEIFHIFATTGKSIARRVEGVLPLASQWRWGIAT